MTAKRKTNTYAGLSAYKTMLTALHKRPMTKKEIIDATGLTDSTVCRWVNFLHNKPNLVYIESWRRIGKRGNWAAVWAAGYMLTDTLKPKPLTVAQYSKRWRQKKAKAQQQEMAT